MRTPEKGSDPFFAVLSSAQFIAQYQLLIASLRRLNETGLFREKNFSTLRLSIRAGRACGEVITVLILTSLGN